VKHWLVLTEFLREKFRITTTCNAKASAQKEPAKTNDAQAKTPVATNTHFWCGFMSEMILHRFRILP